MVVGVAIGKANRETEVSYLVHRGWRLLDYLELRVFLSETISSCFFSSH